MLHLSKINKVANITNKTYHFVMSQLQISNSLGAFFIPSHEPDQCSQSAAATDDIRKRLRK